MTSTEPYPTFSETLRDTIPVVDVIPVAGPPAIFVLAPWLFLVLLFIGPFSVVVAVSLVFVALAVIVAAIAAVVAAPFVIVRHLAAHVRAHEWHFHRSSRRVPVARVGATS